MSDKQFVSAALGTGTVLLLALVGVLWLLASALSRGVLLAWAVSSTVLLPVTAWVFWRLGSRDARAYVSGLERGTGAVMSAANQTADLRTANVGQMRAPRPVAATSAPVALPQPEIVHVRGAASSGEVVDL